jgi:hypothetical protein
VSIERVPGAAVYVPAPAPVKVVCWPFSEWRVTVLCGEPDRNTFIESVQPAPSGPEKVLDEVYDLVKLNGTPALARLASVSVVE